jgi:hypothetical protein
MEAGAIGIELTSFTKKDTTAAVDESEKQQRTQAEESKPAEPTIHIKVGQEQSEQVNFITVLGCQINIIISVGQIRNRNKGCFSNRD